jgi:hypothetical protein
MNSSHRKIQHFLLEEHIKYYESIPKLYYFNFEQSRRYLNPHFPQGLSNKLSKIFYVLLRLSSMQILTIYLAGTLFHACL